MSKIAVVYTSKYGSTRQYAEWVAEASGADLFNGEDCKAKDLACYDVIVYGGAIHAGGITGIQFLKKNYSSLSDKTLIAFAVGLNVDDEAVRQECLEINFVKKLEGIPCYFFRGAYDPEQVKGMDKMMMGMVKKMLTGKNSSEMTQAEQELLTAIDAGANYVDIRYAAPLIEKLKEF